MVTLPLAFSTVALGILIVVPATIVALLGLWLVRGRLHQETLKDTNDVGATIFSMIGVLFTVLLAFIVVIVWQNFSDAESRSDSEVARLGNLLRDAEVFPLRPRIEIQSSIVDYTKSVVVDEWRAMDGGHASPVTYGKYQKIWEAYYRFKPEGNQESLFYQQSLTVLNEAAQYRRLRLLSAQGTFPAILWALLILGAVVTIGFTYMLGASDSRVHLIGVGGLAALTAVTMFLILALNHPFSGEVKVTPDSFERLYEQWQPVVASAGKGSGPACSFCG